MQRMGPGYHFAKTMAKSKNANPIGLVVNAQGDTTEITFDVTVTATNDSMITSIVALDNTVVFATEAGNIECFSSSS